MKQRGQSICGQLSPRLLGYAFVLSAGMVLQAPKVEALPVLWTGNGHFYEVVDVEEAGGWFMADVGARSRGGYLATITSAEENEFVFGLITGRQFWDVATGTYGAWIGGLQLPGSTEPGGGWEWVTSEPWTYASWYFGEPNNFDGIEDRLHYAQQQAVWNDLPGYVTFPPVYVVEYESNPVPEPSSVLLVVSGFVGMACAVRRRRKARDTD